MVSIYPKPARTFSELIVYIIETRVVLTDLFDLRVPFVTYLGLIFTVCSYLIFLCSFSETKEECYTSGNYASLSVYCYIDF